MFVQVDPFDAQEARPYKQDPEVLAMTNLVAAYQGNKIREFEKILATNRCCVDRIVLQLYMPCCGLRARLIPVRACSATSDGPGHQTGLLMLCLACRRTIYDDPFIRQYIEDLLLNLRAQVIDPPRTLASQRCRLQSC